MPAYNAEQTVEKTFRDIPEGSVDEVILTDDASADRTVNIARRLGIHVFCHQQNKGYGANQKTCYDEALKDGADIVVMVHPDYQYDPKIIPYAVGFLRLGICDVILGSRIRTRRETLGFGMPLYKYLSNRVLTIIENLVFGQHLADFHSGFRAYTKKVLETIDYHGNSDDFVFDTEFLAQAAFYGFRIGDVPIPTRYFDEASSISFTRSLKYGFQTLYIVLKFFLQRTGLLTFKIFGRPQRYVRCYGARPES
jgi:glycosyltransferase involved in cell wall biosynthesis